MSDHEEESNKGSSKGQNGIALISPDPQVLVRLKEDMQTPKCGTLKRKC